MRSRLAITISALLTALCLSVALRAVADVPTEADSAVRSLQQRSLRAKGAADRYELARERWQTEYRGLLSSFQAAHERSALAQDSWRTQRKRHRLRGDPRTEARAAIEASQESLAAATDAIRSFHERARVGQAPPGWLHAVEDEFPSITSAIASR